MREALTIEIAQIVKSLPTLLILQDPTPVWITYALPQHEFVNGACLRRPDEVPAGILEIRRTFSRLCANSRQAQFLENHLEKLSDCHRFKRMMIRSPRDKAAPPSELPVQRVARGPLSHQVVKAIEQLVSEGVLREGDRLPTENALAAQFGVGRSTVREATRGLALMGVLDIRVGDGTYIRAGATKILSEERQFVRPSSLNIGQILQARRIVEVGALDVIVSSATSDDIQEIEKALGALKSAKPDLQEFIQCDLEFHTAVIRATKNVILLEMYQTLRKHFQEATVEISQIPGVVDQLRSHEALVAAIKARNLRKARNVMASLLHGIETLVTTHLALKGR